MRILFFRNFFSLVTSIFCFFIFLVSSFFVLCVSFPLFFLLLSIQLCKSYVGFFAVAFPFFFCRWINEQSWGRRCLCSILHGVVCVRMHANITCSCDSETRYRLLSDRANLSFDVFKIARVKWYARVRKQWTRILHIILGMILTDFVG